MYNFRDSALGWVNVSMRAYMYISLFTEDIIPTGKWQREKENKKKKKDSFSYATSTSKNRIFFKKRPSQICHTAFKAALCVLLVSLGIQYYVNPRKRTRVKKVILSSLLSHSLTLIVESLVSSERQTNLPSQATMNKEYKAKFPQVERKHMNKTIEIAMTM